MTVQYVRLQPSDQALDAQQRQSIGEPRFAADGEAMNTELEAGRDLHQSLVGTLAAGQRVGDNPDIMAAIGLAVRKVQNVPENSSDRGADCVQNPKLLAGGGRRRHECRFRLGPL
jgi:hypothetical protein